MRIVIAILLLIIFGYSLMLVITNNQLVGVNLIFSQVAQMNLGLLLIISLLLGLVAGILLSLILFRVFQLNLENRRLTKDLSDTQAKLLQTQGQLEQHLEQNRNAGMSMEALRRDTTIVQ